MSFATEEDSAKICDIKLLPRLMLWLKWSKQYKVRILVLECADFGRHSKGCKIEFIMDVSMLHFSSPAPTGPPLNFLVTAGARSMIFSWAPPNATQRNGLITGYSLSCTPLTAGGDISMQYTQDGTFTLGGFTPFTTYSCSIFAINRQGNGPVASMSIITLETCKLPYQSVWI